jgi:hypothetical protein
MTNHAIVFSSFSSVVALVLCGIVGCTSSPAHPSATGAGGGPSGDAGAAAGASGAGTAGAAAGTTASAGATGVAGVAGAPGQAGSTGAPDGAAGVGSSSDAASNEVSPSDVAANDVAANDAATSVACGADVLCFDFETDTAGGKPGTPWTGQGTIDGTKARSGKNSLHIAAGGDGAFATLKPASFFPPASNEYYGRVMFWVDALPTSHWTFVRSKGPVAGMAYSAEYTYGGSGKRFIANYDTSGVSSDCWKNGANVPLGKWACMEWHFKGATNELDLWVDGVEDAGAHVVGKGDGCIANGTAGVWNAPTFNSLELGFAVYGGATTFSVWYDDLALGKTRLGCP